MYTIHRTDEYLQHHGILGQKWGQRNGPPYPLNESDRSSKEQRLNSKSKSSSKEESEEKHKGLTDAQKRAIKIGAAVTGTALAAVGAHKISKNGALRNLGFKKAKMLKMDLQFFALDPKDYDTIPVSERVLSDIRSHIKSRKIKDPIVHMPHGNVIFTIDNTKRDVPRVIDFEPIPDAITDAYERIKYDK